MINKHSLPGHPDFTEGEVLLINKDIDWTSFDVVNYLKIFLRFEFGIKKIKIGHAGTLDPKATGLVIVCTGKQTKSIEKYQAQTKTYTGAFTLGETTPSWDSETAADETFPTAHINEGLIHEAATKFVGEIFQTPPIFSALKIDGKRAYKYARSNQEVKMRKRLVEILQFEITAIAMPVVHFRVVCSKGTYIRSLAWDFGKALGSGAYLSSLCRTAIGDYQLDDALTIPEFKQHYKKSSDENQTDQTGNGKQQ